MSTFGNELRIVRRNAKLTLLDLAKVAQLSVAYVSQIERGERNPPDQSVIASWLTLMNCSSRLQEFLNLAKSSMTRVSVPLDNKREGANSVLTALARSYEANNLGEDVWMEIKKILEKNGSK